MFSITASVAPRQGILASALVQNYDDPMGVTDAGKPVATNELQTRWRARLTSWYTKSTPSLLKSGQC